MQHSVMRRTLTVIFTVMTLVVTCAAGWPTDHGDNQRSGNATAAARFKTFSPGFTRALDGAVYGSPILAGGHVIAATENNTVYALDPNTGAVKWQRHLRTPISDTSVLACAGNIRPTGITSSPVFDSVTGRLFVVTVTNSAHTGVTHELWGIDPANGAVVLDKRVEVPGTDPKAQQQRAALAVDRGNVYIGFGGLDGDCGNYKGAVLAIKASGAAGGRAYVVPTPREGAIWAPGGPVIEPNGNLLLAVGNGESTSTFDYSDSVTELNPNMARTDFFAPRSWAWDNASDLDLGSMTPALTSVGYVLQIGKSGTAYTARRGHLGGIGGQVASGYVCKAFGVSAITGSTVYVPCTDGVKRIDVRPNGTWAITWGAAGISGSPIAGPGALYSLGSSRLYAINGTTGRTITSIVVGSTSRFATPMLVGKKVYVGTLTGVTAVNVA
jgi:outer membrane protein assembly factor BamB